MAEQSPTTQIHRRVDVTGYTLVSRNWRVFDRGLVLLPQFDLLIFKIVTGADFKGVKELHGKTGILITLATEDERSTHLLVTGELRSDLESGARNFDEIKIFFAKKYYMAVRHALDGVDNFIFLRWDRRYEIHSSEVGGFGDLFQEYFNHQLESSGLSSVLLIEYMGHVSSWGNGININGDDGFRSYNLAFADQVIINFTQTFRKLEACLLWTASSIVGCYPGEVTEYYNFFTGGHGSFIIDFSKHPDYAMKLNVGGAHPHSLLFCTEFYIAEGNLNARSPWLQAHLQHSLTAFPGINYENVPAGGKPIELSRIRSWLDTTNDLCSSIEDYAKSRNPRDKFFEVKLTGIMRYSPKGTSMPYVTSNAQILASIYNKFEEEYPEQNVRSKIAEFPMSGLVNQVRSTMLAAVKTMEPVMEDAILTRTNERIRLNLIPNPRSLLNVLVCEAILSFGTYGRMNLSSRGKLFAAPFYETLGLVAENFRNRTCAFGGLQALRYITVTGETLSYVGPFFATTYIVKRDSEEEGEKGIPANQS